MATDNNVVKIYLMNVDNDCIRLFGNDLSNVGNIGNDYFMHVGNDYVMFVGDNLSNASWQRSAECILVSIGPMQVGNDLQSTP